MSGPLTGVRIIELRALGPAQFAGMVLADFGADVVRVDRPEDCTGAPTGHLSRGRRSVALDLKHPRGRDALLRLCDGADALLEGFRPGVVERLGVGPDVCMERNPRLVYGRMTGWGQTGPLASAAGHDINYISITGALHSVGRRDQPPVVPLGLAGDFGGGGMLLALGVVSALFEARSSSAGQVVDAAMVDGAGLLMTLFYEMLASGEWQEVRGTNLLDSGAPYYDVYETSDGRHVSIGPLEPKFYGELTRLLGLDLDRDSIEPDRLRSELAATFRQRTQREWCDALEGTDACFAPVLTMAEAPLHPHNVARRGFVDIDGVVQPAPAPRFSRTAAVAGRPPERPGIDSEAVLREAGFTPAELTELRAAGVTV